MSYYLRRIISVAGAVALVSVSTKALAQGFVPPAFDNAPPAPAPVVASAPRTDLRFGWSGAIKAIFLGSGVLLDEGTIQSSTEWTGGHRWVPLHPASAPGILGEPSYTATPYSYEPLTSPSGPGVWRLEREGTTSVDVITPVPASFQRGEMLNGYRIGIYPTEGSDRSDAYAPPASFIEVTAENRNYHISEHLTLGQFLTKDQFDVWPKYLALDMRLIDKLELVIDELNAMGVRAERMTVMSGFRTPQYNGPGGDGRAALSRHMWGDAADVWIDNDADGLMDDLNGDGAIDLDDAAVMMRAVGRVELKYPELVGGAGTYPTTSTHGPFIHIDARGYHSRW